MDITIDDQLTWVDLKDGQATLSFYFSDAGPLEEKMYQFMEAVDQTSTETTLTIEVPLSGVVDGLIDSRRLMVHPDKPVFLDEDREIVAAARASLAAAIAKLDSIGFLPISRAGMGGHLSGAIPSETRRDTGFEGGLLGPEDGGKK